MEMKKMRSALHMSRFHVRRAVRSVLRTSARPCFEHDRRFAKDKRTRWVPDMIPLGRTMYNWIGSKPIGRLADVSPAEVVQGNVYLVSDEGKFLVHVVSKKSFEDTTWEDVQKAIIALEDPDRVAYVGHAYKHWQPDPFSRAAYHYFVWKMPREESPAAWARRHLADLASKRSREARKEAERRAEREELEQKSHDELYEV